MGNTGKHTVHSRIKRREFLKTMAYKDLKEEHDLSKDASHSTILKKWRMRLVLRLANRPEGFSKNGRLISGCLYNALNKGLLSTEDRKY